MTYSSQSLTFDTENRLTASGITIQLRVDDIRSSGRSTQGVKAINLSDDDRVASVERMFDSKIPTEEAG